MIASVQRTALVATWIAATLLLSPLMRAQNGEPLAAIAFREATIDAGDVYPFAVIEHRFEFTNSSNRQVRITGVQASDPSATVSPESGSFAAGDKGTIDIRQPVGAKLGTATFRFTVLTDDDARPTQELVLEAFVQSAYDVELPFLDFGDVDRAQGKTLVLEVASREADTINLDQVVRAPEFMQVATHPDTLQEDQKLALNVTIPPAAPLGLHSGVLHLRTDIAHHPDYLVRFQASVFGDIVPERNPTELGVVRMGIAFSHRFQLITRSGKAFSVGAVRDSRGWLEATAKPCVGGKGPSDCWVVTVRQTPVRLGRLDGVLEAAVNDETVPVAYTGLVVARDATIRSLGKIDKQTIRVGHDGEDAGDQR